MKSSIDSPFRRSRIGNIRSRRRRGRGAALVLTLITLVVISIIVTGFVVSMRTEMTSSYAVENTQRTKMIAQGAVSHAIELLRSNIPDPAPITASHATARQDNWITNPGRLTVIPYGSGSPTFIDLHTGTAPDPGADRFRDETSVDLNDPIPGEDAAAIVDDPNGGPRPKMRVAWVPVFKDPQLEPGPENPVIGRYAFWMDDESTRVNFNVALGKPDPSAPDADPARNGNGWYRQKEGGFVSPRWAFGDGKTTRKFYDSSVVWEPPIRHWTLGHPASINLDVLFDERPGLDPKDLLVELHNHVFFHGFRRYPEAIMSFVDFDGKPSTVNADEKAWYDRNKWNLTFYSRSPEFNAFGKSRFFTTQIPITLEGGPSYQMPFTHQGILHFNSLMGSFYMNEGALDGTGNEAGNRVNEAQFNMLMEYMKRPWPGYTRSFVDKYGMAECAQIVSNMLLNARLATTYIDGNPERTPAWNRSFSTTYRVRLTSANYYSNENLGLGTPQNYFWRVYPDGRLAKLSDANYHQSTSILPAVAGPFITEVKFTVTPEQHRVSNKNYTVLKCQYQTELFTPFNGARINGSENPFMNRVDFLQIETNTHKQIVGLARPNAFWDNQAAQSATGQNSELNKLGARAIPDGIYLWPNVYLVTPAETFYVADDEVISNNKAGAHRFDPTGSTDFKIRWRLGLAVGKRPKQMIPMGGTVNDVIEGEISGVDLSDYGQEYSVSWQIGDPRLSVHPGEWIATEDQDTLGRANGPPGGDNSKFKVIQRTDRDHSYPSGGGRVYMDRGNEYDTATRVASIGYWSMIHSGIQNRVPWRTISLSPGETDPPDWLLLDLLGATYPMQTDQWKIDRDLPDTWSTISYMNSTSGQVNLNTKIYPDDPRHFNPPPRVKPLQAVFRHLRNNPSSEDQLAEAVDAWQNGTNFFTYVGELAEVPGYASGNNQWEREEILRNMAGCLTTKTNTFGVWGVAQTVKKARSNGDYQRVEEGDDILGEKRFYAVIERYIWPGKDGVPGNGHTNAGGSWDRLATNNANLQNDVTAISGLPGSPPLQRDTEDGNPRAFLYRAGKYAEMDGPDPVEMNDRKQAEGVKLKEALGDVTWSRSSLEDSYNPPHPVIKYRVAYFKYLDL